MAGPARSRGPALAALADAAGDRASGARAIADRVLRALDRELRGWTELEARERRLRAREIARALRTAQPAMGLLVRWSADWRSGAPVRLAAVGGARSPGWAERWRRRLDVEPRLVDRTVRRRIPPRSRLLTLSRGQTVRGALAGLPLGLRPARVRVLESRPGGEGRWLARDLRADGIRATTIPDADASSHLQGTDLVVIGADTVEADGSVVHKVGTRALARAAYGTGVPLVVIAGTSKWLPPGVRLGAVGGLFDRTPPRWITEYWTDRGVRRGRSPHPIRRQAQREKQRPAGLPRRRGTRGR
ncbi:MAG TPA: hypothetical protein VLX64_01655 [Thermoplasmata archaeon]|nr:hypothetical protein [Thermoplasmata archaeon]